MNIFKRIRKYLDEVGEHPWAVGFKANGASKEALIAWRMLTIEERLAISKNNLFIAERNECLKILMLQGLSRLRLAELSGLSLTQIKRVLVREKTESE